MAEHRREHEHEHESHEHHPKAKDHPKKQPEDPGKDHDAGKIAGGDHAKDVPTSIDDPVIHNRDTPSPKAAPGVPEYRLEVVPGPDDPAVEAARLLGNAPERPIAAAVADEVPMQVLMDGEPIYGPGPPARGADYAPAPAAPANMQGVIVGQGHAGRGGALATARDKIKEHWVKLAAAGTILTGGSIIGLWQSGVFGGGSEEKDAPSLDIIPTAEQDIAGGSRGPLVLTILPDHGTQRNDPIDATTLTLYASRDDALNHVRGAKTLTEPGAGTWTVLDDADEGKIRFAPDPALSGDPAPVYVAVQDLGGLWSNVEQLSVAYTDSGAPTKPVSPMTLETLTAKITQFSPGAVIDPEPAVTENGATPDYATLTLVDASGNDAASLVTNAGTDNYAFRITGDTDKTITFERRRSAVPATLTAQFSLDDTDGKRATPAMLSVEIVQAPRGEMILVDTFQHLPTQQGKRIQNATPIDIDIMTKVGAVADNATLNIKPDSLLLKNVTDLGGGTPTVTFEGEVTQTTPRRWGYMKGKVAGEGVWEIIDQNGTSALRFTRDPSFVGYPAAINVTVTDAAGYESNLISVVLNADVEEIAKGIRTVVRGPAAAFWSAFEGALVPSLATPGAQNPPFEDFYNMLVFLETALNSGFTSTADTNKARGILVDGRVVSQVNRSWGMTGDALQLIRQVQGAVTSTSTGEDEDSLFLRYAQINLMRRVARIYFVTLALLG